MYPCRSALSTGFSSANQHKDLVNLLCNLIQVCNWIDMISFFPSLSFLQSLS